MELKFRNIHAVVKNNRPSSDYEQETLFLKTSQNGRHHVKFLCIGMPQLSCSDDLFNFVVNQLKANKVYEHMNKFVALGSDGASNMIG